MNEDQYFALIDLMRAIAYEQAGAAIHQPRCKDGFRTADMHARIAFDLPLAREFSNDRDS